MEIDRYRVWKVRYMMLIGKAAPGDRVVIVASLPPSLSGKTNFMKIHEIIQ